MTKVPERKMNEYTFGDLNISHAINKHVVESVPFVIRECSNNNTKDVQAFTSAEKLSFL